MFTVTPAAASRILESARQNDAGGMGLDFVEVEPATGSSFSSGQKRQAAARLAVAAAARATADSRGTASV